MMCGAVVSASFAQHSCEAMNLPINLQRPTYAEREHYIRFFEATLNVAVEFLICTTCACECSLGCLKMLDSSNKCEKKDVLCGLIAAG